MGKSFFEKLKKGMDIEKSPSIEEHIEKGLPPVPKEPSSFDNVGGQEQSVKEPSVIKEPSIALVTTKIISNEKNVPGKKKKGKKEVTDKKKKIKVHPVKSPLRRGAEQFNQAKKEPASVKTITDEKENPPAGEEKKWFESEGQLTVDVYQTDKEIVIQSAVAGIEPDDLDITIENDMVTIRGNREKLFEEKKKNYFYQECYWGQFSREIILPEEVDSSRAQATMKKGILTIRIPKIESKKKRKINVK